ncbi:unnamed protein product, partial [Tetraodon nigroviridis]
RVTAALRAAARRFLGLLNAALVLASDLLARLFGSGPVRRHFHLLLSSLVLLGPALSFWVSKYSIFANSHNYLYRKFLGSTWGWTCTLTGSFVLLLSISARRSASTSLKHLSRLVVLGLLWGGCRCLLTLLEDAAGACYEPLSSGPESEGLASPLQPLLLLHEDQSKASCLKAGLLWRGYQVSQEVLVLCLCCLALVEEVSVFRFHLDQAASLHRPPIGPLRCLFLLCVLLLGLWVFLLLCLLAHFPQFPSQQLGGAVGYLGWRGLYQGWFRLPPSWMCPGLPGEGLLP